MRRIYLFTLGYPFGHSEPFLKSELDYIAQQDGVELILVPFNVKGELRTIPDNISLDLTLAQSLQVYHESNVWPLLLHFSSILRGLFKHRSFSFTAIRDVTGFVHHGSIIAKWARDKEFEAKDILYTYWFERITYGLALFKSEAGQGFRLITRAHGYDVNENRRRHGFIPFRKFTLQQLDSVFCISEDGRKTIDSKYGQLDKLKVSNLGIEDSFRKSPEENDVIRVVSCSAVVPVKRVANIFRIVKELAAVKPDRLFVWDHFGDGPLMNKLRREANLKPDNLQVNLHGNVVHSELIEFYNSNYCHAMINWSEGEGIPVSIMEAFCHGIPVLAQRIGGIPEIVDATSGVLIEKDASVEQAAESLAYVISNPGLKTGARDRFISGFQAEVNYKEFYDYLL